MTLQQSPDQSVASHAEQNFDLQKMKQSINQCLILNNSRNDSWIVRGSGRTFLPTLVVAYALSKGL